MIKCPCYKCKDREVGCHGKCQKPEYLQYEIEAEERRRLIREGKAKGASYDGEYRHPSK